MTPSPLPPGELLAVGWLVGIKNTYTLFLYPCPQIVEWRFSIIVIYVICKNHTHKIQRIYRRRKTKQKQTRPTIILFIVYLLQGVTGKPDKIKMILLKHKTKIAMNIIWLINN